MSRKNVPHNIVVFLDVLSSRDLDLLISIPLAHKSWKRLDEPREIKAFNARIVKIRSQEWLNSLKERLETEKPWEEF